MQNSTSTSDKRQPDYELHIPGYLKHRIIAAILTGFLTWMSFDLLDKWPAAAWSVSGVIVLAGLLYVMFSTMVKNVTNLERRLKGRDRLLNEIHWQGDEKVLDVGCGNGKLILEAAKRLTTGKGIGIDIWAENAGDSQASKFIENAEIEGVSDKVILQNEDVRNLPYEDNSFEVIISGLTMHHILHGSDSEKAMPEMVRVLKPGGKMGTYDVPIAVNATKKLMLQNGLEIVKKDSDMVFGIKPET